MGEFGGGGADNLDYSSHTYERLRAAVYGVDEEGIRVAQNEWADLKRRLHERTGTLHVLIAKLTPAWSSPAGRQALGALEKHREWMTDIAKVAAWNEDQADKVQEALQKAGTAMRALDEQPGGPNQPSASSTPSPSPAPAVPQPGGYTDPASEDWRQPHAAKITRYVYGQMAVAAASMALPPTTPKGADSVSGKDSDQIPGDGPVRSTPANPGGSGRPGDAANPASHGGADSPRGSSAGVGLSGRPAPTQSASSNTRTPAGTWAGMPDSHSAVAATPTRTRTSATSESLHEPGRKNAGNQRTGGDNSRTGRTPSGVSGSSSGSGPGSEPGRSRPGASMPDPGHRQMGGTPTAPAGGGGPPPMTSPPTPVGGAAIGGRSGRGRPRNSLGARDVFVDRRAGNRLGGTIGPVADRPANVFDPGPGVKGAQKNSPAAGAPKPWDVPEPEPVPETAGTERKEPTPHDGTQFQVKELPGGG